MKSSLALSALLVLAVTAPAFALSPQLAAKKELQGWSVAAKDYEQTCDAGKLRQQMPPGRAIPAYECFAKIIQADVDLQYPDLYKTLDEKMKAAHEAYAHGQPWDETLKQLTAASDEYNAAVAKRNAHGSGNN